MPTLYVPSERVNSNLIYSLFRTSIRLTFFGHRLSIPPLIVLGSFRLVDRRPCGLDRWLPLLRLPAFQLSLFSLR
jgi:hypothetical protein